MNRAIEAAREAVRDRAADHRSDPAERGARHSPDLGDDHNGTVRLHGHVHSLWEKKIAEEAAESAPGVQRVENEIIVTP
jgi:hypothetical protein